MKKIIAICLCLFIIHNTIISQNEFGSVGSYWRYSFEPHNGDGWGWTMIIIEKDTLIDGEAYKQFKRKHHYKPMFEPAIEYSNTGLLKIQNDSIFIGEKVFLDFDMGLTDSLYIEEVGGIEDIQLAVDSITIEEIGGFEYRKWHGEKICLNGGNGIGPYEPFTILETVGQIEDGYLFWNVDGCAIGGGTNYFRCYKNGEFTYPPGEDCVQLFFTSVDELLRDEGIDVFPNPSRNLLNVKSKNKPIDGVFLLTLDGKEMFYQRGEGNQIELDISKLEQGMYLVKIKSNEEVIIKKFIKR